MAHQASDTLVYIELEPRLCKTTNTAIRLVEREYYKSLIYLVINLTQSREEKASASEVLASVGSDMKLNKARHFRSSTNEIVDLCRAL